MRKPRTSARRKLKINIDTHVLPPTFDEIERRYGLPKTLGNPNQVARMAMDEAIKPCLSLLQHGMSMMDTGAFPQFLGYGALTMLSQDGLIRAGVGMISKEMTQKWITLQRQGEATRSDESLSELETALAGFKIRSLFRQAADNCGYFGGCLIYIDTGEQGENLLEPLKLDTATIPVGTIRGLRIIEPFNVSPGDYDGLSPLSYGYYKPSTWWVLGRQVHASRFLYFAQNRLPSILLPAYNFFGIPLAQIVLDAVGHFTECREASARLLTKFSQTVLKTNMADVLTGGASDEILRRVQFMVQNRNNDGVEVIDKESEDIINVTTPLSGVTDIVRQSMEMVSAYFNEPCTKMWGISPAGMNATGESDEKNHNAHIASLQEEMFRSPLETLLKILQLNRFGRIDESITFKFNALSDEDETKISAVQKARAETDNILIAAGVLSAEEARSRLAHDPDSGYNDIDVDELPEIPEDLEVDGIGGESKQGADDQKTETGSGDPQQRRGVGISPGNAAADQLNAERNGTTH